MTYSGWRKPTPGLEVAHQCTQAGEQESYSRTQCIIAVKRVAAHIGLKAADVLLLDTLAGFSKAQDWEQGRKAIVWPSNSFLMEITGFSLSTLKRHIRRLIDLRIITCHDSSNGKRWGKRNEDGHIVEAYGFDLTPLAIRAGEFVRMHTDITADRALRTYLKRQITKARRDIHAWCVLTFEQGTPAEFSDLKATYDHLIEQLPKPKATVAELTAVLDDFQTLQDAISKASRTVEKSETAPNPNTTKVAPKRSENDPHIQSTNQDLLDSCNEDIVEKFTSEPTSKITIAAILKACPQFQQWAQNASSYIRNWQDMARTAQTLGVMIGVPDLLWKRVVCTLGIQQAVTALALVFEKFNEGTIRSSQAYMLGILRKHHNGELYLHRSLFGRFNAHVA